MNTTTLTTPTPSIPNTYAASPYRVEAYVERCVVCGNDALLSCPRRGRHFCELHARVSGACADCEPELSARTRQVIGPSMVIYTVAAVVPVYLLLQADVLFLTVFTTALLVFGALLVAGCLRGLVRRGANKGWAPLPNRVLHIAADGGDPPRRRPPAQGRERCMYRAAYNAGFNRVQGCA